MTDDVRDGRGERADLLDEIARKAAWMLDNGATNENRDLCESVLSYARLCALASERDRLSEMVYDGRCTTCGTPAEIVSTDEGTSYVRPISGGDER